MAQRLFADPPYPAAAIRGEETLYPVHRIFCVGRNYAEHAKEMGVEVDREAPFYFLKDAQALVPSGAVLPYPCGTSNYHYEMELVVALGAPLFRAGTAEAGKAVFGYACGLDMTRRDLQLEARAKGRPWDLGKNFERSAVLAPILRAAAVAEIGPQRIWLSVDGAIRQEAHLSDLVWRVDELLSHLSHYYHLQPGDLVFTGTPAGVGAVTPGAVIAGGIDGLPDVTLTIGAAE
ncbi:fumarylacetoacetate hydrolase family protein [Neotabrizicola sp. VNH66]|uniref:fumarylacetoacetate hydrolase family protein n=1 Tax=Neotabrizicola sp. VNH66 TaxID=3400918 RepID=UPI003BFF500A